MSHLQRRTSRDWFLALRPWSFPASTMPVLLSLGYYAQAGRTIDIPTVPFSQHIPRQTPNPPLPAARRREAGILRRASRIASETRLVTPPARLVCCRFDRGRPRPEYRSVLG